MFRQVLYFAAYDMLFFGRGDGGGWRDADLLRHAPPFFFFFSYFLCGGGWQGLEETQIAFGMRLQFQIGMRSTKAWRMRE